MEIAIDLHYEESKRKYPFKEMKVGDTITFPNYSRLNMSYYANAFRAWARYREMKGEERRMVSAKKVNDTIVLTRIK